MKFHYGYVIVSCSFLILMIAWGSQYSFGVFFKPMLNEFGFSRAALSGAYSINLVIQSIACIFTGRLSDRYGPRLVVTVCGISLGVSYLLLSQAQEVWQIYAIFGILASIGAAGMWVPLLSTIARWFVLRRALMSGIAAAGVGVGIMLLPPLSSYFISIFGWRTAYIIMGVVVLALIILSAQMLRRDPSQIGQSAFGASDHHEDSLESDSHGFSFREALRTRQFWLLSAVFLILGICLQSVLVHIVPHATDVGIPEVAAATIISAIGGISILSKVAIGIAVDRLGSKPIAIMATSMMAISLIIIQFFNTLGLFYIFAVIFAFAYGGFAVMQSPYLAELFGLKSHGAIFGFILFLLGAGAFGPVVAGKIFDVTSSYHLAFTLLAILSFLGVLFACAIKTNLLAPVRKKDDHPASLNHGEMKGPAGGAGQGALKNLRDG